MSLIKKWRMIKDAIINNENKAARLCLMLIAIITFAAFANGLNNNFTNWDDDTYVTQNPYIKDLSFEGVKTIFSVYVSAHYHPLTLLSLAVDYSLWGYNSFGYILTNILFHIFNSLLLFVFLRRLSGRLEISFIAVLLFAIHPMRVESVIWISERKDVLYVFFSLLALLSYQKYITNKNPALKLLSISFLFFTAALLSKASAVIVPLLMLLTDFYYRRTALIRIGLEKTPFFALSLIFGLIAIDAQSGVEPNLWPFPEKLFLASYALNFYLIKFFAPFYQSAIIPFPEKVNQLLPLKYYFSVLLFPALIYLVYKLRSHRRELLFGLLLFIIPLLPILIKFPIGPAFLAERYTYIPHMGLSFLVAYFYNYYRRKSEIKHNLKNPLFGLLIIFMVFLLVKTIDRNAVWRNNTSLFTDIISKNYRVPLAHHNLGNVAFERGHYEQAIPHYSRAIEINAAFHKSYLGRGLSYYQLNKCEEAIDDFTIVLKKDSNNTIVRQSRALCFHKLNKPVEAISDFDKLIEMSPENTSLYNNRGGVYLSVGLYQMALKDFEKAIALDSTHISAYNNKALLYEAVENFAKAADIYTQIIELSPRFYRAYNARGIIMAEHFGELNKAYNDFNKAYEINPLMHEAVGNMLYVNLLKGDTLSACKYWRQLHDQGIDMTAHAIAETCQSEM